MSLTFTPATDRAEWDRFLGASALPIPFAHSAWQEAIQRAFPFYTPRRFWVERDGAPIGGWVETRLRPAPGVQLVEAGIWGVFGGWIPAQADSDAVLLRELLHRWEQESDRQGVCRLLWTPAPEQFPLAETVAESCGFRLVERKGTHYLALPERPEELWRSVKGSVRTDVRKAQKRGVNVREATKEKDVQACYRLYVETMSRLGGLAKPLRMVAALSRPPLGQLWIAEREGRAIAALLALVLADRITIWLNASNAEGRQLAANHLLYYSVLSWAIENGCRLADFGASPPENRGLIHFKASWGAVERPFGTFQKELRPLRSALWHFAEPRLRRLYRAVQRLR